MPRWQSVERHPGLQLAIDTAGGVSALARGLKAAPRNVSKWKRCPQDQLFAVATFVGMDAKLIRPDLASWIEQEERRRWMTRARERFSLIAAATGKQASGPAEIDQLTIDALVAMTAIRFAASERGLELGAVLHGRTRPAMQARAWAMALAHVVGRGSSTTIGQVFMTSRQNVDNASERYLRARDGDHPEDFLEPETHGEGRVKERGRVRPVREADASLQAAEERFRTLIELTARAA